MLCHSSELFTNSNKRSGIAMLEILTDIMTNTKGDCIGKGIKKQFSIQLDELWLMHTEKFWWQRT